MGFIRLCVAGLMLSFAWPVRGQFGHEQGALIVGCLAAAITAIFMQQVYWRENFAKVVVFGAIGFGVGGAFGYGKLVDDIIAAPELLAVLPELLHVFLIGAIWGGLGMIMMALALSDVKFRISELIGAVVLVGATWYLASVIDTDRIYILCLGAALLSIYIYNMFFKKSPLVTLFAVYGFFGFGLGFLVAVVILWLGSHGYLPGQWWSLRDQIWGFCGGVSVLLAADQAVRRGWDPARVLPDIWNKSGFIFMMVIVTGVNTYNVYQKWFLSEPPISHPMWAGIFLSVCAIVLAALAVYFMMASSLIYRRPKLETTLLWTSLFFCWYVGGLAILKSTAYAGNWETGFTLILLNLVIFTITFPIFLKK